MALHNVSGRQIFCAVAIGLTALCSVANASDISRPLSPQKKEHQQALPAQKPAPEISGQRPSVNIMGRAVTSSGSDMPDVLRDALSGNLPASLRTDAIQSTMADRRRLPLYAHAPARGQENAPVTLVEMMDLSCLQCMQRLREVEEVIQAHGKEIRHVYLHLPVDFYNSSNPAAFYGRVAQSMDIFWDYRDQLMNMNAFSENIFFEKLVQAGANPREVRRHMRDNARTFYRELDADTAAAKQLGEEKPPVFYINGIRVDHHITTEQLSDLIEYEINQRKANL